MIFAHPDGGTFEIPDDWWTDAGMYGFVIDGASYRSEADSDHPDCTLRSVAISDIAPMRRNADVPLDFGGFDKVRMVSVLTGISKHAVIKPVKIRPANPPQAGYSLQLYDGIHRYHASIAAGFTHLPALVEKWGVFD